MKNPSTLGMTEVLVDGEVKACKLSKHFDTKGVFYLQALFIMTKKSSPNFNHASILRK